MRLLNWPSKVSGISGMRSSVICSTNMNRRETQGSCCLQMVCPYSQEESHLKATAVIQTITLAPLKSSFSKKCAMHALTHLADWLSDCLDKYLAHLFHQACRIICAEDCVCLLWYGAWERHETESLNVVQPNIATHLKTRYTKGERWGSEVKGMTFKQGVQFSPESLVKFCESRSWKPTVLKYHHTGHILSNRWSNLGSKVYQHKVKFSTSSCSELIQRLIIPFPTWTRTVPCATRKKQIYNGFWFSPTAFHDVYCGWFEYLRPFVNTTCAPAFQGHTHCCLHHHHHHHFLPSLPLRTISVLHAQPPV